jgi:hypothetical protein
LKKSFKKLTVEEKEYFVSIYKLQISQEEKQNILSKKFKVRKRTIRGWAKKLNIVNYEARLTPQLRSARKKEIDTDADIVFVAAAQNETPVNQEVLSKIKKYKKFIKEEYGKKVQILVIPARYRNPTSLIETAEKKADQWWDKSIDEYLVFNKLRFDETVISADSRINPTASMPLNGFEGFASDNNLVLGHPRVHIKTLPRYKGMPLRTMNTTGFITYKNYSDSRAGEKGNFHHSFGFTILEKGMMPRIVKMNVNGDFTDINNEVTANGVRKINSSKGMVLGDIHHKHLDHAFFDVTKDFISKVNPEKIVAHDVLDGTSFNPHIRHDMYAQKQRLKKGDWDIKKEVNDSIHFLKDLESEVKGEIIVCASNHDVWLDRHINSGDWKKDLLNSEAYLEYALIQQSVDLTEHSGIYGYLVNINCENTSYLPYGSVMKIGDYMCGNHGDKGVSGTRGTVTSFKKYSFKMMYAHQHAPSLTDGVMVVGVSCHLWQAYNSGSLSAWAYAHGIVHETGKNQLLIFTDDYKLSELI